MRANCRTVRRATCPAVVSRPAGRAAAATSARRLGRAPGTVTVGVSVDMGCVSGSGRGSGRVGRRAVGVGVAAVDRLTGDREEDLVEGGAPEADVVDLGAGLVDGADRGRDGGPAALDGQRDAAGRLVDARLTLAERGQRRGQGGEVLDPAGVDLDDVAAAQRLQLVGRAVGDDPAVVDDHDLVGELVGLLAGTGW